MDVHDIKTPTGELLAFEVSNLLVGRRGVRRIVRTIPGSKILTFKAFAEEFCEFEVGGVRFVAWEPWNDNSRYWIGPKPPRVVPQLSVVRDAFLEARLLFGLLRRRNATT